MAQKDMRKYMRHPVQVEIEYSVKDGPSGKGLTVDVGLGGLSFVGTKELPVGTELTLTAPKICKNLSIQCKVVGVEKREATGTYVFHVKALVRESRFAMLDLIEKHTHITNAA